MECIRLLGWSDIHMLLRINKATPCWTEAAGCLYFQCYSLTRSAFMIHKDVLGTLTVLVIGTNNSEAEDWHTVKSTKKAQEKDLWHSFQFILRIILLQNTTSIHHCSYISIAFKYQIYSLAYVFMLLLTSNIKQYRYISYSDNSFVEKYKLYRK